MKRTIFPILLILFAMVCFTCVSMGVSQQGRNYFVGKSENTLTKYFGYTGEIYDGEGEYDRILYFTDRIVRYTATKQTTTRYKTSDSRLVSLIAFVEYNDGCLHLVDGGSGKAHYEYDTYYGYYIHNTNDNAFVKTAVNKFNGEGQRLKAVDSSERQASFQKSKIGDWYYIYEIKDMPQNVRGYDGRYETCVYHGYAIYRIDIEAEDRTETKSLTAVTYIERDDAFYDADRNTISEERGQFICDWYEEQGYDILTNETGISLLAYIKNGKIVKVE
ncbi:hypothetical protein AGMMS50267_17430 [Spirochaetia bacterium]|nr:hypothetical protein AGMMS50267_17430 [Spirochaetia bacterium]